MSGALLVYTCLLINALLFAIHVLYPIHICNHSSSPMIGRHLQTLSLLGDNRTGLDCGSLIRGEGVEVLRADRFRFSRLLAFLDESFVLGEPLANSAHRVGVERDRIDTCFGEELSKAGMITWGLA